MNDEFPNVKREAVIKGKRKLGQADWTGLNENGKNLLVKFVARITVDCAAKDYKWVTNETFRTINPDLTEAFEMYLYWENNAVVTEYVNGAPRWSAKGGETLEMAYVRFKAGSLTQDQAWAAAGNDCECGNAIHGGKSTPATCWSSEHDRMRSEMEQA
ncbi:hypothetical protein UFOVP1336_19 [uncultured Caudovirales phage]|uniref:Uncharacterized protein n=1 Tax=uncultured Caudovirales phage TaxID=2100421 RepID=A0A6J5S2I4_9CAUD|nr:hypothetical protein UFOVP1336_19 [uncultured Caudovirales phage]